MSRRFFNDGQEIKYQDLNGITEAIEKGLFENVFYHLLGKKTGDAVFFDSSFKVLKIDSLNLQVAPGFGILLDESKVSPESKRTPLVLDESYPIKIDTPDSFDRIDVVGVSSNLVTEINESRNYKDPSSSSISQELMTIQKKWSSSIIVVKGASLSPEELPQGFSKIAEVLVSDSGISQVYDKRTRFFGQNGKRIRNITSDDTIDFDDNILLCNGTLNLTLPSPDQFFESENLIGKQFTIKNIGTGVVTLLGTIDGLFNETIDAQNTSLTIISDGSAWYYV